MNSTAKKCQKYTSSRPIFLMRRSHINGNLYHYAGNNPVCYTDPTGMFEVDEETKKITADIDDKKDIKKAVKFYSKHKDYAFEATKGKMKGERRL